ncbi:MAG: hypothetical protein NT015_02280 [Alphaproteobacteria bacterium]|nr:hypothetical protein [Alphaproteobacteria bacterium]
MDWFSPEWLALFVAAIGAVIAIQSLREATRNSRLEKIADVLMECTRRYGDLIELRHTLKKDVLCGDITAASAANRYYHAYWNLQWDQWTFFRLGLIPHEIFGDWFLERLNALSYDNDSFGGTFERGWTEVGRKAMTTYPDFVAFVDAVWALKARPAEEARRTIDARISEAFKEGRRLRIGFVRKSLSRSS